MPEAEMRDAVKAAMDRQNLSARRLAARLGVTKETVLDFIHGRRKTQPAVRALICRELGLDSVESNLSEATPA